MVSFTLHKYFTDPIMCHNCQAGKVERNSGKMYRKGRNIKEEVSKICKV